MKRESSKPLSICVIVLPNFNLAATVGFIDPFRAANYLDGQVHFHWQLVSVTAGAVAASNGMSVDTRSLPGAQNDLPDIVMISASWAPESHGSPVLNAALRRWARAGVTLGSLDTGAFILAELGLLAGRRATVHYEHLGAFKELYPDILVSDQLFVLDGDRITCCGGAAALDLALHLIRRARGDTLANHAARYLFHEKLRSQGSRQNAHAGEPLGSTVPAPIRKAIQVMERNLELALPIPRICQQIGISQRQLDRLFRRFVQQTPALYYRDIRLDRARGLVTQTELPLAEVAVASGFLSQVHFSRAYRTRFGIAPSSDRIEGRIPFEFRAWPLHHPALAAVAPIQSRPVAKKAKS